MMCTYISLVLQNGLDTVAVNHLGVDVQVWHFDLCEVFIRGVFHYYIVFVTYTFREVPLIPYGVQ